MVKYLTSDPAQECVDSRPELRTFSIVLVSEKQEAVGLPSSTDSYSIKGTDEHHV